MTRARIISGEDKVILGRMIRRGSVLGEIATDLPLGDILGGTVDLRVLLELAPEPVGEIGVNTSTSSTRQDIPPRRHRRKAAAE